MDESVVLVWEILSHKLKEDMLTTMAVFKALEWWRSKRRHKLKKEARLRGAKGKLEPRVYQEGNSHDKFAGESLVYGGTVYAEIKFSL